MFFKLLVSALLVMTGALGVSIFHLRETWLADVTYSVVRSGTIEQLERATGYVLAPDKRKLSFATSGVLRSLHVEAGSIVRKGQLLAELEADPDLNEKLASGRSLLSESERRLRDAEGALAQERVLYEAGLATARSVKKEEASAADETAKLERARSSLHALQLKAGLSRLVADADAQVVSIDLVPKQSVSSSLGVTLVNPQALVIDTSVDEVIAARLAPKQAASYEIAFEGQQQTAVSSRIVRVSATVDRPSGAGAGSTANGVNVQVAIEPEHMRRVRLGQKVELLFSLEKRANAVLVPSRALVAQRGQQYLLVLQEGTVLWMPVETGIERRDVTEIRTASIVPGMRIVIPGAAAPMHGQKVAVRPS